MNSALYHGTVRHRRFGTVNHEFRYRLFMTYLDLAELPELFDGRWLWSARRPAPAWFRRADYLGDACVPLDQAVRALVQTRTGEMPKGPIRMLTHLRFFGIGFNPVTFYFCFERTGRDVETIVAEITNTPWNERYAYVLAAKKGNGPSGRFYFEFDKVFHVSPFLSLDYRYCWSIVMNGDSLQIHLENHQDGQKHFDATLALKRRAITGRSLAGALLHHPCMTAKVVLAIYWQALRLWWKRCPFFAHPGRPGKTPGLSQVSSSTARQVSSSTARIES